MSEGGSQHQSITNSKMSKRMNGVKSDISQTRLAVFQMLNVWDDSLAKNKISSFYVAVGLFLQCLQILSFAFAPVFIYRAEVALQLSYFVEASLIPIWDSHYGNVSMEVFIAFVSVFVFVLVLFWMMVIAYTFKYAEQRRGTLDTVLLRTGTALSSFLFLPLLHIFLAAMPCGGAGNTVANFPSLACNSGLHTAATILGAVGLVLLVALALFLNCTLGDVNPNSTDMMASAHHYVDGIELVVLALLAIFRHVLIAHEQFGAYNIILILGCAVLFLVHATVLPYYTFLVGRVKCTVLAVTILAAIINCAVAFNGSWVATQDLNSFLFLALSPLAGSIGLMLSRIRISKEHNHRFRTLFESAFVDTHTARYPFPEGVMSNDLKWVKLRFRTIESDIIAEDADLLDSQDEESIWERDIQSYSEILCPTVTNIIMSSDTEVSTRFVERFKQLTSFDATSNLLAFATRIYTKSLMVFRRSGLVKFAFANFLFRYLSKLNIALEVLEEIEYEVGGTYDLSLLYTAFKVNVKVKELFGMRDSSNMRTFVRAKGFHRESLSQMASFWQKVMDSSGDLTGLALISHSITEKRRLAGAEYARAFADRADRLLYTLYASFLENVIMDSAKAADFREIADEIAENKKNTMLRGSRAKSKTRSSGQNQKALAAIVNSENMDLDAGDDNAGGDANAHNNKSLPLSTTISYFLFGISVLSVLLLALQIVRVTQEVAGVEQISTLGNVRAASEKVFSGALSVQRMKTHCGPGTCEDRTFSANLYTLSNDNVFMRSQHNSYVFSSSTSENDIATYLQTPTVRVNTVPEKNSQYEDPSYHDPLHPISNRYDPNQTPVVLLTNPWNMIHELSYRASSYINALLENKRFSVYFHQLREVKNTKDILEAVNNVVQLTVEKIDTLSNNILTVQIVCFVFGLFVLLLNWGIFLAHMKRMAKKKAAVLSLFSLIPYPTLEVLHSTAKKKLEAFERMHADDEEEDELGKAETDLDDDLNATDDNSNKKNTQGDEEEQEEEVREEEEHRKQSRGAEGRSSGQKVGFAAAEESGRRKPSEELNNSKRKSSRSGTFSPEGERAQSLEKRKSLQIAGKFRAAAASALAVSSFADDDQRKMSRFFGVRPNSSVAKTVASKQQLKSCIKVKDKKGAVGAKPMEGGPGKAKKKQVTFNLPQESAEKKHRKIKEPKVKLDLREDEIMSDLDKSIKMAEEEERTAQERMKQKHDMEMEKLIHGGMQATQIGTGGGAEKHSNADDEEVSSIFSLSKVSLFCVFACSMAVLVLSGTQESAVHVFADDTAKTWARVSEVYHAQHALMEMQNIAVFFSNFGNNDLYHAFFDAYLYLQENPLSKTLKLEPQELTAEISQLLAEEEVYRNKLIGGCVIGMALAARSLNLPLSSVPRLYAVGWENATTTSEFIRYYPGYLEHPEWYVFPSLQQLQEREVPVDPATGAPTNATTIPAADALQRSELLVQSLLRLTSERVKIDVAHYESVANALKTDAKNHFARAFDHFQSTGITSYLASMVLAAMLLLCSIVYVANNVRTYAEWVKKSESWKEFLIIAGAGTIAATVACFLIAILAIVQVSHSASLLNTFRTKTDVTLDRLELISQNNHSAVETNLRSTITASYILTTADLSLYRITQQYNNVLDLGHKVRAAAKLNGIPLTHTDVEYDSCVAHNQHLENIGMLLAAAADLKESGKVPPFTLPIDTYDFSAEKNAQEDEIRYASDHPEWKYTTYAADLAARTPQQLRTMARFATYGRRGYRYFSEAFACIQQVEDDIVHGSIRLNKADEDKLSTKDRELLAVAAIAVIVFLLGVVAPYSYIALIHTNDSEMNEKNAETMTETLYTARIRKIVACLLLIAIVYVVQLVMAFLSVATGHEASEVVDIAYSREYYISETAKATNEALFALDTDNYELLVESLSTVKRAHTELVDHRDFLYRRAVANQKQYGSVTTLSPEQRSLTFSTGGLDSMFLIFMEKLVAFANSELALDPVLMHPQYPITSLAKIDSNVKSSLNTQGLSILADVEALGALIHQSNEIHKSDAIASINISIGVDVAVCFILLLCVILSLKFVVQPIADSVTVEEKGTTLLLNMIPLAVREMVPKIQVYLESEILVDHETERKAYVRHPVIANFIKKFQSSAAPSLAYDVLRSVETGVIVINATGTVKFANTPALDLLQYEKPDLMGQNIKIIVDEPLRSLHDGFLQRFVQQGTSRIVGGGRDVLALTKTGQHVHVFLDLYEAIDHSGQIHFVGELRKYDWNRAMGIRSGTADGNQAAANVRRRTSSVKAFTNKKK